MSTRLLRSLLPCGGLLFLLLLVGCGAEVRLAVRALPQLPREPGFLPANATLKVGDRFALQVTLDRPAFVYALEGASLASAQPLIPVAQVQRSLAGELHIPADRFLVLDPLSADVPVQTERIYVVASHTPLTEPALRQHLQRYMEASRGREGDEDAKKAGDEGKKDEGKKDEGKKDEGKKDEGKKDEGKKDEGRPVDQVPPDIDSTNRGPVRVRARLRNGHPAVLYFEFKVTP